MTDLTAWLAERDASYLGALCEEPAFNRFIDTVAGAIADRFALKIHTNIAARRMAFTTWIDALARPPHLQADYRGFVTVCARLVESIARCPSVSYSTMMHRPADRMIAVVAKYSNEVTALAAGASLYDAYVGGLTGERAIEALPALVVENAAASLARCPEAASIRFRELLRLSTPWS